MGRSLFPSYFQPAGSLLKIGAPRKDAKSRSGYPECKEVYKDNKGKPIFNTEQYACPNCKEGFLQLRSSNKGKFWGCRAYPACQTIVNDKRGQPAIGEK